MAAVKPKRHGPAMDMTAMCDVAFLLLTFFIMTTQFKNQETVKITTPTSIAPDQVEDKNVGTISISNDGRYFFGVADNKERSNFISTINADLNLGLTSPEINSMSKIAEVGVGKDELKAYLNLSEAARETYKAKGIPCDSANTELIKWVQIYQKTNPSGKIAIRGDVKTQYPAIKILFEELGKVELNKFKLITKGE
jgi:biopolymer transport protein ExbD